MAPPSTLSAPQELFINGEYSPSDSSSTFPVVNPMTGETIYQAAAASVADYERAIQTAHAAFASWSKTSPSARRLILLRAADIMDTYLAPDSPSRAAEILSAEVSAVRSWVAVNIRATAGIFRETAGLATHIKGEIIPADRPGTTILVERAAVGVVLAISPWNAPVNLTARAIACPLICGNTVVLKPSEMSPKSQHLVVRALAEAGLPPGVLNFLPTSPADAPAATEHAVKHPLVRRVNFTGGDRVGRIIAGWAAEGPKQCVLELGGKAPVLVLEDADVDDAVEAVVFGGLSNAGQICMSTERVLVHQSIAPAFTKALLERVARVRCGNHLEEADISMSGLCSPAAAVRVLDMVRDAVAAGARLLTGDLQATGPNNTIVRPHVLEGVTPAMDMFRRESFGPVLALTTFSDDDEAVALANDSDYSLCASVFSHDVMRALAVARRVRAGSCHVNGPTVYIEATLPNGGTGGSSGYGRFGGMAGVEEFTERKIVSLAEPGMRYDF
ncbi:Aldehyde/histidinol dehydrogenase [Plectosphaerella cucumerina]|uniref:Aldehyde/histidinol dehydrogenase n=1 Tax=Plectosphaerella cucumerina TaxID=40658 RepID=A0A8K0TNG7_9PEZI|nr:Aldehyde/histidinol dehydrogenase [Plectosphaerella cucumerina]